MMPDRAIPRVDLWQTILDWGRVFLIPKGYGELVIRINFRDGKPCAVKCEGQFPTDKVV